MTPGISRGPVRRAQRTVIYGPEGVGKSTFASLWPNPVYIDTESGTDHLDVARFASPRDWTELLGIVDGLYRDPMGFGTLVLDTADGAEALCRDFVLRRDGKSSIEAYGYGKGYTVAREEFRKLLDALSALIDGPRPMNVVVCAHSQQRKVERPEDPNAYDHYELKTHRSVSADLKEWADAVLFVNFETFVVENDEGVHKAKGGKVRRLYADHDAAFDAKNRWGLPDSVALDEAWSLIEPHVTGVPAPGAAVVEAAESLGLVEAGSPASIAASAPAPTEVVRPQAPGPAPVPEADAEVRRATGEARRGVAPGAAPATGDGDGEPWSTLHRLMREAGVSDEEVRSAMQARGYRPFECPISDYPDDLVGWMVSDPVWPGLVEFIVSNRPPFN